MVDNKLAGRSREQVKCARTGMPAGTLIKEIDKNSQQSKEHRHRVPGPKTSSDTSLSAAREQVTNCSERNSKNFVVRTRWHAGVRTFGERADKNLLSTSRRRNRRSHCQRCCSTAASAERGICHRHRRLP